MNLAVGIGVAREEPSPALVATGADPKGDNTIGETNEADASLGVTAASIFQLDGMEDSASDQEKEGHLTPTTVPSPKKEILKVKRRICLAVINQFIEIQIN